MNEVTNKGVQLIERWRKAQDHLEQAKREVTKVECEVSNARNELGKWLTPADARNGEQFCVWHGDSLITATKDQSNYKVEIRKRGRSLA